MTHLKRLRVPRFWKINKKETKWTVCPKPGAHKKLESIPIRVLLRDIFDYADTGKEARQIVKSNGILVDKKIRKDDKFSVGLMDTVDFVNENKYYRVSVKKQGLIGVEISKQESEEKLCKIVNKTTISKDVIQLNLHDGKNILIDKTKDKTDYKTGDSILFKLPELKIKEHLKFEKGMIVLLIKGQNQGRIAKIKEVKESETREPTKITLTKGDNEFESNKDCVLIIGKEKPVVKLE